MRLWNALTGANVTAYRLTGGRLGGRWKMRNPILLLDHRGARSGKVRTAPLAYMRDGDDLVVVASRGGSDSNPAWLHNLRANPEVEVQVGSERYTVVASEVDAQERARLWPRLVEENPDYASYQRKTDREIPVIVLRRAGGSAGPR
jgi:deazaflavin-dependent oxidoreductase (nitroreductase family)